MQQPLFFDNQIIKTSNLNFLNTSASNNINNIMSSLTLSQPGVVAGLNITGSGSIVASVTPGYGFLSSGEFIQLFQPSGIQSLPFSGIASIYANLIEVNYNPNPVVNPSGAGNVASGLNASTMNFQPVEQYNLLNLTTISGIGYIKLGDVTTNGGIIENISYANRQNLKLGPIDLFNATFDGSVIASGTLDSNSFVNPLNYTIFLNSGVSILYAGSGNNSIASYSNPLGSIFATSGTFHQINGFSPILIDSLVQNSGTSLESIGNGAYVQIDKNNMGTQFGGNTGITLNQNSISLISGASNLNITTSNTGSLNISTSSINTSASVNVSSNNINVTNGNINITNGTISAPSFTIATLGISNGISGNTNVFGNLGISGTLAFSGTTQLFDNIVPNYNLSPSGVIPIGVTNFPHTWTLSGSNIDYQITGFSTSNYLQMPTAFNSILEGLASGEGSFTVDASFMVSGTGSLNPIWSVRGTGSASSNLDPRLEVGTNGQIYLHVNNPASGTYITSANSVIVPNQWYCVSYAYNYNLGQSTLFVNGVQKAVDTRGLGDLPTLVYNQYIGAVNNTTSGQSIAYGAPGLYLESFRFSNFARDNNTYPATPYSGLTIFPLDDIVPSGTFVLYNFQNKTSGVNTAVGPYLPPSSYNAIGNGNLSFVESFLGISYSGSTVSDYTQDNLQPGTTNVFSGITNSPYWFMISGTNINSNGLTAMTSLDRITPGQPYNISYFTKLISGSSANIPSNSIIPSAYITGNGLSTPIYSGSVLGSQWSQNSFLTIPPSGMTNPVLYINLASNSGAIISGGSIIGLASVQATQGNALLSPHRSMPTVMKLTHSSINNTILTSPASSFLNTSNTYVYYSGNIFSDGGEASIIPTMDFVASKLTNGSVAGTWLITPPTNTVTMNGNTIINQTINAQTLESSGSQIALNINRGWTGYLNKGLNTMIGTLTLPYSGTTSTCTWKAISTDVPMTTITIY